MNAPPAASGPPPQPRALLGGAVAALLLAAVLVTLAPAGAHDVPEVHLNVTAHDTGPCTGEQQCWFTLAKNDPDGPTNDEHDPTVELPRGAEVHVHFENQGSLQHSIRFEGADAEVDPVDDGSESFTFTVPWDAPDEARYYCTVGSHDHYMNGSHESTGGNTAPNLAIDAPAAGAEVRGTVTIEGGTIDGEDDAVGVEVQLPGSNSWTDAGSGGNWDLAWNTTTVEDGNRTFTVRATDAHGFATYRNRTVQVVNDRNRAPSLSLGSPPPGAEVEVGEVTITGTASDPEGALDRVEVQAPPESGTWRAADGTADWSFTWNASRAGTGNHTLLVRAVDAEGAATEVSLPLEVVEETANRAPRLTLSHPSDGARVQGSSRIAGNASDPDGEAVTVEVQLPTTAGWTAAQGPDAGGAWHLRWNASALDAGRYTIPVRAGDGQDRTTREVTVRVPASEGNPPTVRFVTPSRGQRVSPPVTVIVESRDIDEGDAVDRVRVRFAGQDTYQKARPTAGDRWRAEVPGDGLEPGPANLTAVASDGDLASRAVLPVTLPGAGNQPEPRLNITLPPPDRVEGLVTVRGVVHADYLRDPPLTVEMRVGEDLVEAVQTPPGRFQLSWNAHGAEPGVRDITIQAFDGPASSEPMTFAVRVGPPAEAAGAGEGLATPGPGLVGLVLAGVAAAGLRSGARAGR